VTASRSLSDAHPLLADKVRTLQAQYAKRFAPWHLIVTSVWRSPLVQEALYAQGRVSKMELNAVRHRAGLPPIYSDDEAARIVTRTRSSRHNRTPSEAVDLAVAIDPDGDAGPMKPRIDWQTASRYEAMGELAERLGLVWGGRWRMRDLCHVELPSLSGAQREET
jgi:hypothetical protein